MSSDDRPLPTYIVHAQRIVAEDLRDILAALGIVNIILAAQLSRVPVGPAALVIVAAAGDDLTVLPHMAEWAALGVPVVVLNGVSRSDPSMRHVVVVAQPFDPDAIKIALTQLKVV